MHGLGTSSPSRAGVQPCVAPGVRQQPRRPRAPRANAWPLPAPPTPPPPQLATRRALALPPPPRPSPPPLPQAPPFCSQTGELASDAPASPTSACPRPSPPPPARWSCLLPPARAAAGGRPCPLAAAAAPTPAAPLPHPRRPCTRHGHPGLARGTATQPGDTCSSASGRSTPPRPPTSSPRPRPPHHAHTPRGGWWCGEAGGGERFGRWSGRGEAGGAEGGWEGRGGRGRRPRVLLTAATRSGEPGVVQRGGAGLGVRAPVRRGRPRCTAVGRRVGGGEGGGQHSAPRGEEQRVLRAVPVRAGVLVLRFLRFLL